MSINAISDKINALKSFICIPSWTLNNHLGPSKSFKGIRYPRGRLVWRQRYVHTTLKRKNQARANVGTIGN